MGFVIYTIFVLIISLILQTVTIDYNYGICFSICMMSAGIMWKLERLKIPVKKEEMVDSEK